METYPREMVGKTFGRLTVIEQAEHKGKNKQWLCKCECGNKKIINGFNLRIGHTRSCGCFQRERAVQVHTRHGQSRRTGRTGAYKSWLSMMDRCYNRNNKKFKYYGARGVIVYPNWHDFVKFSAYMGARPIGMGIGRIGDSGNYEPSNVRWMTMTEQTEEQRKKRECNK